MSESLKIVKVHGVQALLLLCKLEKELAVGLTSIWWQHLKNTLSKDPVDWIIILSDMFKPARELIFKSFLVRSYQNDGLLFC